MVRIVSDTSTLYSSAQARAAGFAVSPLSVTIAGKSYREFDEISSDEFVAIINEGNMPTSSQPAIGEVSALYEELAGEQILNIAMAAGLSGTYQSAAAAAELCDNAGDITVLNSRTLCGPHRYLVEGAVKLAKEGTTMEALLSWLNKRMDTAKSYLIPADFDYLRRGGRLSPLVSHVGKLAGLSPVMIQTDDGTRLTVASIKRGFKGAVKYVVDTLHKHGIGAGWKVYISHAAAPERAEMALEQLRALMPGAEYEIVPLSPAFITQGGPKCMAIQYVEL
ncbi:MAG: DegV family protein [Oscillospiraceae bacterium]|nr:DegV family protein [Oscillospiraceae bacterium]